jgi:hypothetical protein
MKSITVEINPLNAELNPICYLLALLGTHHFLHVSRIRVILLYVSQVNKLNDALYFKKNALDTEVIHLGRIQQNVDYTVFCNEQSCIYFKS